MRFVIRQRKCANGELLSHFQAEAPMHRPSFYFIFSLTMKDKTKGEFFFSLIYFFLINHE
jgi:hypothetical protein